MLVAVWLKRDSESSVCSGAILPVQAATQVSTREPIKFLGDFVSFYEVLERCCEEDSKQTEANAAPEESFKLLESWSAADAVAVEGVLMALLRCTKKSSKSRSRCCSLVQEILGLANQFKVAISVMQLFRECCNCAEPRWWTGH